MKASVRMVTLIVCLFSFPLLGNGQVFDNTCPSTQASIVPLRTVNLANGHFNDTVCVDITGNLIFLSLNPSLNASDTFTRADGPLGLNWTITVGATVGASAPVISGNAVTAGSGTHAVIWSNTSFVSNSQFAQATIVSIQPGDSGPMVFGSSAVGAGSGYACSESTTTIFIRKITSGSVSTLTSSATTGAIGDVLRLEITSAGAMTCFKNGVSILTTTDISFKNGAPGFYLLPSGTITSFNNWSGGNLPAIAGTGPTISGGGTLTSLDHNKVFWAGPGPVPTIDQALALCGANTCFTEFSPLAAGPESSSLVTTSMGYKVFAGPVTTTVVDRRGLIATSATPTAVPLYPVIYGGRMAGQLTRTGCNMWASGTITDSTVCATNFTWVQGTLPTNNGSMFGAVDAVFAHDALTFGGATNITFSGHDAEAYNNATSSDIDMPYLTGSIAQSGISRANGASNVTVAAGYAANQCANVSSTAKIANCYGYDSFFGTSGLGVARNYGYHNKGNWLTESNTSFDFVDAGFNISSLSAVGTTDTVTTSVVCTFPTGATVYISGTGTNSFGYNGTWTVLAPGCNGTSSFTFTNTASGLGALGAVGIVAGVHKGFFFNASDQSVTMNPYRDTIGWKWVTNDQVTRMQFGTTGGLQVSGGINPLNDNGTFLGNSGSHFAGLFLTTCAVNSVSPAACGAATAGAFVVPTTTTTYTVNTTSVNAASRVFLMPRTYAGDLPSAPTCVVPAITAEPVISALSAGTSFTIAIASTAGQTCWNFFIVN